MGETRTCHRDGRRAGDARRATDRQRTWAERRHGRRLRAPGAGRCAAPSSPDRSRRGDKLADFVQDFAPTVVAHFGVYEPAVADERPRRRTSGPSSARSLPLRPRCVRPARVHRCSQRLEVYGPAQIFGCRFPTRMSARPRALRTDARVEGRRALRRGSRSLRLPCLRAAVRPGSRLARAEPARPLVAPPGCALSAFSDRRSRCCIDDAATPWSRPSSNASTGRAMSSVRAPPRRGRRRGSAAGYRCPCSRAWGCGRARVRDRGAPAIAPHVVELMRYGCTGDDSRMHEVLHMIDPVPTQDVLASFSIGPTSCRSHPDKPRSREMTPVTSLERHDIERMVKPGLAVAGNPPADRGPLPDRSVRPRPTALRPLATDRIARNQGSPSTEKNTFRRPGPRRSCRTAASRVRAGRDGHRGRASDRTAAAFRRRARVPFIGSVTRRFVRLRRARKTSALRYARVTSWVFRCRRRGCASTRVCRAHADARRSRTRRSFPPQ